LTDAPQRPAWSPSWILTRLRAKRGAVNGFVTDAAEESAAAFMAAAGELEAL
jgi:hypothetical protein